MHIQNTCSKILLAIFSGRASVLTSRTMHTMEAKISPKTLLSVHTSLLTLDIVQAFQDFFILLLLDGGRRRGVSRMSLAVPCPGPNPSTYLNPYPNLIPSPSSCRSSCRSSSHYQCWKCYTSQKLVFQRQDTTQCECCNILRTTLYCSEL